MRWLALLLLTAAVSTAGTVVVFWTLEAEYDSYEETATGEVVTNRVAARVIYYFTQRTCRYQSATTLPLGYSAGDLSNAVAAGSARMAANHHIPDWRPQEILIP